MTDGVSTTTRNEAAERLFETIGTNSFAAEALRDALATERRNLVERLRHRLHRGRYRADWSVAQIEQVDALLDELGEQRP